jgi:hypothetical protein
MAYSRTVETMMRAPFGVKPSVVTPVFKRSHLCVSLLLIAAPCQQAQQCHIRKSPGWWGPDEHIWDQVHLYLLGALLRPGEYDKGCELVAAFGLRLVCRLIFVYMKAGSAGIMASSSGRGQSRSWEFAWQLESNVRKHTPSPRSHLPQSSDPPHAIVSSIIVDPASVPIPTLTCVWALPSRHRQRKSEVGDASESIMVTGQNPW